MQTKIIMNNRYRLEIQVSQPTINKQAWTIVINDPKSDQTEVYINFKYPSGFMEVEEVPIKSKVGGYTKNVIKALGFNGRDDIAIRSNADISPKSKR